MAPDRSARRQRVLGRPEHRARRCVDLDPFHPQLGESFFSTYPSRSSVARASTRLRLHASHRVRVVLRRSRRDHPDAAVLAHSRNVSRGVPMPTSTSAHRHPLDVGRQHLGQERILLVAAVEPHFLAEQARRNPEPDPAASASRRDIASSAIDVGNYIAPHSAKRNPTSSADLLPCSRPGLQ